MNKQKNGNLLAIIVMILLFGMISFVTNLASPMGDVLKNQFGVANWMGTLGLSTARFFIDECWGVASFCIPLFLIVASLRIMQVYKVRLWKWFLNCSIIMIWFSAFGHFLLQPILESMHSPISLGGGIGKTEVEFLEAKIGSIGTFLILIAFLLGYLIYLSDETIHIIRKILSPTSYLKSKKKNNAGVEDDEEELQDELLNNTDQEAAPEVYTGLTEEETATTIEFNDITPDSNSITETDTQPQLDIEIVASSEEEESVPTDDETKENTSHDQTMHMI